MGATDPKQPRGTDEGFCLSYYHLSYRRKFIRTLWLLLFSPLLLFLPPIPYRETVLAFILVTGILQAVYNYRKWRAEEKP